MSAPDLVTDWKTVALFLAGLVSQEHPGYTLLIFQLIADNTTNAGQAPAERI